MADCIIIGATLPGLALGALLARKGKRVVVIERTSVPGGRAALWEREGYTSLSGIQRIRYGKHGAFTRICRAVGIDLALSNLETLSVLDVDGKVKRIPTGYTECITTEFFSLFDRIQALRMFRTLRNTSHFEELEEVGLEEWFVRDNVGKSLQRVFSLLACEVMNCTAIERISSGGFLASFKRVLETGCYLAYPRWGWEPLLQSFQKEILKRGEIRWNCRVDAIRVSHGRVRGVETGSQNVESRCVVSALPCQQLFKILSPGVTHQEFVALCRKSKPSAGIIMDFAMKHRVTKDKGMWFFLDPPSYGVFVSNLCHRHAPPGRQLATCICPCSIEEAKQADITGVFERKMEQNLRAAFPGIETSLEWKRSRVVLMLDSVEMNIMQTRKDRPGYHVPNVEGLYMVGDSTCAPGVTAEVEYESVLGCYEKITGEGI